MVSSLVKNENAFCDEDMDDVSHEIHKKLLHTITSKTKRKIQPSIRNEPSLQVSEFHLTSGQKTTNVNDLTNALKKKAPKISQQVASSTKKLLQKPLAKVHAEKIKRAVTYDNFKKHISRWSAVIEKNKSANQLKFPLKSNEIEVFDNRMIDFTNGFSQPSDLQKKITDMLQSSDVVKQKQTHLKMSWLEKEKEKYPLTLKELLEKRRTMVKFRAQESYRHSKAHRQNKIKSKKYHRLLRKEKTKEQIKEFEKLQDTDPVAALEKLNDIEKTRAEERASLRHKSTGQWARNHVVRAKYDKDSRIALAEQLRKSKELTQKVGPTLNEINSDDSDNELIDVHEQVIDPDNPWLTERKEFKDFMSGYKHFIQNECNNEDSAKTELDELNNKIVKPVNQIKKKKTRNKVKLITVEDLSIFNEEDDGVEVLKIVDSNEKNSKNNIDSKLHKVDNSEVIHTVSGTWYVSSDNKNKNSKTNKIHRDVENAFKNVEFELKDKINKKLVSLKKVEDKKTSNKDLTKRKNKDVDSDYLKINKLTKIKYNEPLYEDRTILNKDNSIQSIENNQEWNKKIVEPTKQVQNIDPTKFIHVPQINLETEKMDQIEDHLDDKEEENEQDKLIAEAFADDDIVNEFKEEKKKLEEQSKPKLETGLPGWGRWAGPNIKKRVYKKRSNMGMFRTPAKPPRKDFNREKVIIHENADDTIKSHLVSELPYPFKDVEKYEETIKTPVGRTWVPETIFQKLTAPPVVTQMGQIIDPIDENSVVQLKLKD